ncbi:cadherin-like protein 26 [Notechis scutatus]|uniref:Cadherin-like protein 26 n=1 Tax=Notechis scutatus TaxID=8663 RepID=A0A6J1TWN9_9SAUR|nr:cadherin-like protein 26 [Notechis scutatus]
MPASPQGKWGSTAARFLLAVLAIHNIHYTLGNDIIVHKNQPKRSKQDWDPSSSLRPLRRTKRRWVITTIELEEEGRGPFPKMIGELFNKASQNTSIKYSISGPGVDEFPEYGLFSIEDDARGLVYVHHSIDRERTPSFPIRFDVHDRKTGAILDSSLFFNIQIKDINDNAPEFLQKEFNINIKENHNKKEPVFKVIAVDKDQEDTANSEVVFCLVSQTPELKPLLFTIDSTSGLIYITQCLDYETNRNFRLVIRASDRGSPSLSSTATINISMEDSNNNLPVFTQENYYADIPEGKTKDNILRLKVEDKDSPNTPAWRAEYTIKKGNERGNFAIVTDPKTNEGVLSVIKPLVYSTPSERRLLIVVKNEESFFICQRGFVNTNASPQLPEVSVSINITDENNAPQFNPPILKLSQQEGVMPGTKLVQYEAQDPDTGQHKIKYKVVSDPAGWVTIDENSGIVTAAKTLDRESPFVNNNTYTVVIHATDDGVPPLTGTGTIQLYLSDLNDNAPMLVTTSLTICEGNETGPFHIEAEDRDSYPYAEPFTFQLEDALEGTEKLWRLGESTVGLALLLCSCISEEKEAPTFIPYGAGNQSLIHYNEESEHVLNVPDSGNQGTASSVYAKIAKEKPQALENVSAVMQMNPIENQQHPNGNVTSPFNTIKAWNQQLFFICSSYNKFCISFCSLKNVSAVMQMNPIENQQHPNGNVTSPFNTIKAWNQLEPLNHQNIKTYKINPLEKISEIVAVALKQKCEDMANMEDNIVSYAPCVYASEGALEKNYSSWSLSILEDDKNSLPEDFLGVLEPRFIPLAKICSK